ncbi:unnamed protein product [Lymnaea stagnalis]|uniref:C2H2-type domain-containing protein n=1 Tax=Lymnaea stagnalis TaxID=6523 RepID=A0AAV2HT84_LYMST
MVKDLNNFRTKCAICWQTLRPKSPLLHGTKCNKYEIREKLKLLLPPQDFKILYDEKVFINPRLCNICFVTIRKIPKTISKVQSLVGKKLNIKLYKPSRAEWIAKPADSTSLSDRRNKLKLTQGYKFKSSAQSNKLSQHETSRPTISYTTPNIENKRTVLPPEVESLICNSNGSFDQAFETIDRHDEEDENEIQSASLYSFTSDNYPNDIKATNFPKESESSGLVGQEKNEGLAYESSEHEKLAKESLQKSEQNFNTSANPSSDVSDKTKRFGSGSSRRLRKTCAALFTERTLKVQPQRESKRLAVLRGWKRKKEASESSDSGLTSDVSACDDNYIPPSTSSGKSKALDSSEEDFSNAKATKFSNKNINNKKSTRKTQLERHKNIKQFDSKSKKLKPETRAARKKHESEESAVHGMYDEPKTARDALKVDIPKELSANSKSKLRELVQKAKKCISEKKKNMPERIMIKCSMNNCDHFYPLWSHMAVHLKYYHYDGATKEESDFAQKMSMLAENDELDKEMYPFKCRHRGCDLAFTNQEFLREHKLVHGTDLVYVCGFPDCTKAFKLPRSLHIHIRSHTGERPFLCDEPACGKSFKDSKDLTKHRCRHTAMSSSGEKTHKCTVDGCTKTFFTISERNSHRATHTQSKILGCDICGRLYKNEKCLLRHKRRIHGMGTPGCHKCPYNGCEESFVKKEKLEIHLCSHSPERLLFCEKCGKKFSCQRYLDVHYKIHLKNETHAANPPSRTIPCEYLGCGKMFTTRGNMKAHVLNQHKGRKPKALPGVFFSCAVEGCGKRFSFRSTLYRHNKLVHKGGDYKLGRELVKYFCNYEGCLKEFNRKTLLEEHMVMEHGKTPKRLLPLRNKELDFIERICVHCGMVLTITQLPRHEEVYHSEKAISEMKETSPYPCHLKGCDQLFNAIEDRKAHVETHIDYPPFTCCVGECKETFYLEKNLDNHLWNHSKKQSVCEYEGCYKQFDDQLELAKHSKVHYANKMKCPWPNCDNWISENSHLKPHFIAHSRTLRANFDSDFVCEICELTFKGKWGLMIHKRLHGDDAAAKPSLSRLAKFTCEELGCEGTFVDHTGFFDHFLYHYIKVPARCDFNGCTETFHNMITLSRHTKSHYDGKLKCPWDGCGKYLATVFTVKKHMYRHIMSDPAVSAGRQHSCKKCFMMFRRKENFDNHQEQHNEKPDYVCPTCGKKGRHNHLKSQSLGKPRKPQVCQHCGARYATISGLKFHMLQKHKIGKWPLKCRFCGKGFMSSREMERHIPTHTKEKPFVCHICGASFASHTGHRAHLRKHLGQKYECDVDGCGKVYTTSVALKGHKAQHAGFSKTCPFCGKTYKNPYGHKCKASRDKRKIIKTGQESQGQSMRQPVPVTVLPQAMQQPFPPQLQSLQIPQQQIVQDPVVTSVQHTIIIPQQVVTHNMDTQQTTRSLMTANTLNQSHLMQQNLTQVIPQGMTHGIHHGGPHQNIMQDRGQPMDMTRGNSMDMTDYAYNNYVVFWDSQNL